MSKKKILISFISVIACIMVLACVVLATVDDTFTKGENYDVFHEENGCCTIGSDSEPHYVTGYKDGLADQQDTIDTQQSTIDSLKQELNNDDSTGDEETESPDDSAGDDAQNPDDSTGDSEWKQKYQELLVMYNNKCEEYDNMLTIAAEYVACLQEANRRLEALGGETVSDPVFDGEFDYDVTYEVIVDSAYKQGAVNEYLQSDEYLVVKEQTAIIAVNEYKRSDDYKQAEATQFELGRESGYQAAYGEAYDVVYSIGLADGYADFMSTKQFESIIETQCKSAAEDGYKKGYEDGKANSVDFDATTLISLIAGIVIVMIAIAVLVPKLKKLRKKRG